MGVTAKIFRIMQARVGRGEYNPANSRVLHFVHNPEAEARREHEAARISELEAESATLRAQLQALQPKEAGVEPESMAAAVAAAEKTVLEQKVSITCISWYFCIRTGRSACKLSECRYNALCMMCQVCGKAAIE